MRACPSVDEPRDNWRGLFFSRFLPLVQDARSLSEATLILNRDIWGIWGIIFEANQTPDIMSPFQVKQHWLPKARLTGVMTRCQRGYCFC